MEQLEFTATENEAGVRIDRCLSDKYEELSRSYLQKLLKEQGVTVNGKAVKANYKIQAGDLVQTTLPDLTEPDILPENIPLDILYEDDVETLGRLFNAYVSCLIGEYLLDEAEIDCLISRLNEIKQNEFKLLFENLEKANEQEHVVRDFLNPHFEAVITQRTQFMLPSPDCIIETMAELVEEDIEVQTDAR